MSAVTARCHLCGKLGSCRWVAVLMGKVKTDAKLACASCLAKLRADKPRGVVEK